MSGPSAVIPSRGAASPKSLDVNPVTVTAFLGVTERGPLVATECTSLAEYQRIFGGNAAVSADMDIAIRSYYLEGGAVCQVGRVTHHTDSADPATTTAALGTITLSTSTPTAALRVDGKTRGAYANALSVRVAAASNGKASCFNLYVVRGGINVERFVDITMDATAVNYVVTVVNSGVGSQLASNLIAVADLIASNSVGLFVGLFGPLTSGSDGLTSLVDTDYVGGQGVNGYVGLHLFDQIPQIDILCVPGRATSAVQNGAVSYAETQRKSLTFVILDPPAGLTCAQMRTYQVTTAALQELSEVAAIYYPRSLFDNPNPALFGTAATLVGPPSGMLAGICARLDASKPGGAFEHPASIDVGSSRSARGIEVTSDVRDEIKRGLLFDTMVNPIMVGPGTYVDGARCLKSTGPFPTVGESRGVMFVSSIIAAALDPKRNRNIRPRLRNEVKMVCEGFLRRLTKAECFASNDDALAWKFDIGAALNTAADANARRVNARVGLATSKPAEFFYIEFAPLG